jgi:hypothetical protein
MAADDIQALRRRVHGDSVLALRLRRVAPEQFTAEVLRVASEIGCDVDEADLRDAIAQGRRAWTTRWLR